MKYFFQMRVSGKIREPFVKAATATESKRLRDNKTSVAGDSIPKAGQEAEEDGEVQMESKVPNVEEGDLDADYAEERDMLIGQDNGDNYSTIKDEKSIVSKASKRGPVAKQKDQKSPIPTDKPAEKPEVEQKDEKKYYVSNSRTMTETQKAKNNAGEKNTKAPTDKPAEKDEKIIYVSNSRTMTEAQKAKNNAGEKNTKVYRSLVDMRNVNSAKTEYKLLELGGFNSNATYEFEVDVPYNRALCPVLEFYLWDSGQNKEGKYQREPSLVGMSSIPLKKQLSFVYDTTEDDAYVKMWKKYL
jgi:hypothetical protein